MLFKLQVSQGAIGGGIPSTPWKFNIAPENDPLEKEIPR